jgi:hypothetical protein
VHSDLSGAPRGMNTCTSSNTEKKKKNFLVFKEVQNGAVAKSYMRKGFLIYEEMGKNLAIYKEAVSRI